MDINTSYENPIPHALDALLFIAPDEILDCECPEFSPELITKLKSDWEYFLTETEELGFDPVEHRIGPIDRADGDEYSYMANDWILTRNGAGTGFWDHGRWAEPFRQELTALCRQQGEIELYLGDDGLIYSLR